MFRSWRQWTGLNKGDSFRRLWMRLFLAASLIIVLPILALGIWFGEKWESAQLDAFRQQRENRLRSVAQTVQQCLSMVENEVLLMKSDSAFVDFQPMNEPGEHVAELLAAQRRLGEVCTKFDYALSSCYYDARSNRFLTNAYGTVPWTRFYDRDWLAGLDGSNRILRLPLRINVDRDVLSSPERMRGLAMRPEAVLTVAGSGTDGVRIAVNIGAAAFYDYLDKIYSFEPGEFEVTDASGGLILGSDPAALFEPSSTSLTDEERTTGPGLGMLHREGSFLFVHPMQNGRMIGILRYSDDILARQNSVFRNFILLASLLVAVMVVLAASQVARWIYTPVDDLLKGIRGLAKAGRTKDEDGIRDEISSIKGLYEEMAADRTAIERKVTAYELALREHAFREHLDGVIDFARMTAFISPDQVDFAGRSGRFLALNVLSKPEDGRLTPEMRMNIGEIVGAYVRDSAQGIFLSLEGDRFLAYVCARRDDEVLTVLSMICRLVSGMLERPLHAGVSDPVEGPEGLRAGHHMALAVCRHSRFFGIPDRMLAHGEISRHTRFDVSFVVNFETRLVRAILYASRGDVAESLNDLRGRVLQTPDIPFARGVYLRLLTALVKEFDGPGALEGNPFERLESMETLDELDDCLRTFADGLIARLEQNCESQQRYCAQAKALLEARYLDRNLSVCGVSDELGISYPYLSKIFKDTAGMGLLDYLNAIRIERSKELLLATDDNLSDIAEKVGYSNPQSFQRFFKRIVGVTPGEYRKTKMRETG